MSNDKDSRYLTVDYERSTFRVSQAKWTPNASQNLTSILSIDAATPSKSPSNPDSSHKLSTGATIGIIVAAVCLCLLLIGAGAWWFFWRRKKGRSDKTPEEDSTGEKAEFEDTSPPKPSELQGESSGPGEVEGDGTYYGPNKRKHGLEMEGSPGPDANRAEVPGTHGGAEVEGSPVPEMDGGRSEVFELPAGDFLAVGTGSERRGRRSRGSSSIPVSPHSPMGSVTPVTPQSPRSVHSPASAQSPANLSNEGSQRDSERRRERDRRRERGRASDTARFSWMRSEAEGNAF